MLKSLECYDAIGIGHRIKISYQGKAAMKSQLHEQGGAKNLDGVGRHRFTYVFTPRGTL